jgi:uncharacterized protein (DUF427 family)
MSEGYPLPAVPVGHIEQAPRRVRGLVGDRIVFDTTRARYVWESPYYPQYYIPLADVDAELLVDEAHEQRLRRGTARRHALRVGDELRPASVRVYQSDADPRLAGTARFEWSALDAWFEEDEQIFVHPRNPYVRVDALRSDRHVRVQLDGVLLAESKAPVLVFETGLPPRHYVSRSEVDWTFLQRTDTVTECPYKGVTSDYWSVTVNNTTHADLAWSYQFPTATLLPIAGLVAFYDEHVDTVIDGVETPRPVTRFTRT